MRLSPIIHTILFLQREHLWHARSLEWHRGGHLHAFASASLMYLSVHYNLEFLGLSSFVPGLFLASLFFFAVNVWILGIIVEDVGGSA